MSRHVQETVSSAVKPPRAKPARHPLPWAGWQQLAQAHPALVARRRPCVGLVSRILARLRS